MVVLPILLGRYTRGFRDSWTHSPIPREFQLEGSKAIRFPGMTLVIDSKADQDAEHHTHSDFALHMNALFSLLWVALSALASVLTRDIAADPKPVVRGFGRQISREYRQMCPHDPRAARRA